MSVQHTVWVEDGKVMLCNDDDTYYVQEFSSFQELNAFVTELLRAASKLGWIDV